MATASEPQQETGSSTSDAIPKCIYHYMPQIFWHDRKQIMSVHMQPSTPRDQYVSEESQQPGAMRYKICTASVQHEVRIWEVIFCKSKKLGFEGEYELGVNFVANLTGHNSTLNLAQYSPSGELIASGDVEGKLYIWQFFPQDENFIETEEKPMNDESAQFDIPPNKENWKRAFAPVIHDRDLNAVVFSPNSQFICTAANDDLRLLCTKTGRQAWCHRNFRRLITGLAWDPLSRYVITMSSDRRMDIVDARKGLRLRDCYSQVIPETMINGQKFEKKVYKFFFDQHVYTLTRSPDFSPCGELLFAPAGHLETADASSYGTYVFRRCDFDRCLPYALFPCAKPTLMVRVCPVKYKLRTDTDEVFIDLPYRLVFAVMCSESIYFYDTQTNVPIGFVYDISYDNLTSISWSPDGKVLVVSSLEGFNTFLHIRSDELESTNLVIERAMSPPIKKPKEPNPPPIQMEFGTTNQNKDEHEDRSLSATPSAGSVVASGSQKSKATPKRPPSSTKNVTPKRKEEVPKKRKINTFFERADEKKKE